MTAGCFQGVRQLYILVARQLNALVFPDKCLNCSIYIRRSPGQPLSACFCRRCMGTSLPQFSRPFCTICGRLFDTQLDEDHLCAQCLERRPSLDRVRAAFAYKGVIKDAVAQLKYRRQLSLARLLEHHLFDAFCTWFTEDAIHSIVPVPLHRKKAVGRGFNQSYLLIRNFPGLYRQRYGGLPAWTIDIRSLVRVRHTPTQTGLDEKQREKNLKDAFVWTGQGLEGRHILLVDDVFTTGSTCKSAARTLKAAGAARVSALVLARA